MYGELWPDQADVTCCGSPSLLMSERASWRDRLLCPRIHLQDNVSFGYHHPSLGLPPRCQSSCPPGSPLSPTLATDPCTLEKASVPPSKRHCRSLSVPEDLSHWQPRWRPLGSKVWTAVKQRGSGRGEALEEPCRRQPPGTCSLRLDQAPCSPPQRVQGGGGHSPPFFSLALSRESPVGTAWESGEALQPFSLQRRFSLSPVRLLPSPRSSACSTPEPLLHQRSLPRSRSQPCDLDAKKSSLKRRHDEHMSWHRPSLDFDKMNQTQLPGGAR
ncbi:PREDICTED: protein FAM53C, partial [Crocodylus porosus]